MFCKLSKILYLQRVHNFFFFDCANRFEPLKIDRSKFKRLNKGLIKNVNWYNIDIPEITKHWFSIALHRFNTSQCAVPVEKAKAEG